MQNKKIIGTIAIVIVVAGLSFWGGMKYGSAKSSASQLANRQGAFAQNGGARGGAGMRGGAGGGLVSGKVLSIDATSMTVELGNGSPASTQSGSKIVFFSRTAGSSLALS